MRLARWMVVVTLMGCGGKVETPCDVEQLPTCDPQQVNERCVESCGWLRCDGDVVMFGVAVERPDCKWMVDAGVDVGADTGIDAKDADPACDELMALRVCSSLELGSACETKVCDGIEWYRCPPGQTEPLEPQQEGDCRWGKGSV